MQQLIQDIYTMKNPCYHKINLTNFINKNNMPEQISIEAEVAARKKDVLKILPESALDRVGQIVEGSELPLDEIKKRISQLDFKARESVWARDGGHKYDKLTPAQSEALRTLYSRLEGLRNYGQALMSKSIETNQNTDQEDYRIMQGFFDLRMLEVDTTQKNLKDILIYLGSTEDAMFVLDKVDPRDNEFGVMTRFAFSHPELKGDVVARFTTESRDAQAVSEEYLESVVYRIGHGVASVEEYHILARALDDVKTMVDRNRFNMSHMLPIALESKRFQDRIADKDRALVQEIIDKVTDQDKR